MKKRILITFREGGENGGPYNSHLRIMNSELNNKYEFMILLVPKGRLKVFNPNLTFELYRQIRESNPEIIHCTGLELIGYHVCLASLFARRGKLLLNIHGSSSEANEVKAIFFKRIALYALEWFQLKVANKVVAVSNYCSTIPVVKRVIPNGCETIYNIVNVFQDGRDSGLDFRKINNIRQDKKLIVSVGRIVKEKGFALLAEVIEKCSNPGAQYIIIGDGDYLVEMRNRLKSEEIAGKVIFTGYRKDALDIVRCCDIFVMASFHETFCMALAEAGLLGLALVAFNVGGVPEIIEHKVNGILVDEISVEALKVTIDDILDDADTMKRLKEYAAKKLQVKFQRKDVESKWDVVYASM